MSDRTPNLQSNFLAPTLEPLVSDDGGPSIRQAFDQLQKLGFRAVQLTATQPGMRPRELDASARRDLISILRRRELSVAGLDLWIPPKHFLDAATADRAATAVQQAIELGADLGRVALSLSLPHLNASDSAAGQLKTIIDAIGAYGEKFGVAIANHATPQPRIEGSNIGVGIDPAAWLSQGKDPAAACLEHGDHLVSARLCDLWQSGLRGPIGNSREGQLDLTQYKVALSVTRYSAPIVIDARQWTDPWRGIEQTRAAWGSESAV